MHILLIMRMLHQILSKRKLTLITTAITGIAIISSTIPNTVFADAEKRVEGSSPFSPGETVTIEFRIPKPTNIQASPVEIVFVVDASGSLSSYIESAKTEMKSFANWLSGYYGFTKVGIVSFGMDEDNSPGLRTHMALTPINSSTDITSMTNAINAISARDISTGGFSDIQKGIIRGNSLFTDPATVTASGRHLILLTDGLANYPTSNSIGFGYPWDGVCPLLPNSPRTSISGLRYSQFIIIPQGSTGNAVSADTKEPDYSGTGMQRFSPPCESYIDTHHGGYLTGMGLIDDMIAYYPGQKSKQNSMAVTISFLQDVINPYIIKAQDTINTAIFTSIPDAGLVRNCSNSSVISSNNTVGGSGLTLNTNTIPYSSGVSLYCVRFKATLKTGVTSGTYPINSNSGSNRIRYYNVYNTEIASDGIQAGSITIAGNPDMETSELWLTNSSGTQKRVFDRNEEIYVHTKIENIGDSTMPANFKTAFYKNASSTVAANTSSDIPMYITGHGALGAGGTRSYDSFSSSFPSTTDPNTANTNGARPWTQSAAANYNAVAFTNYTQTSTETNFPDNNRRNLGYSVITPPSGLQTQNLLCYRSDLTWTAASSNVTGYDVSVTDMAALLDSIINGTPYNDYPTYDHSIPASPTNMSVSNLKPNTLYSWSLTPKTVYGSGNPVSISFTTPDCPSYTMDLGGPYAAEPGEVQVMDVNISYTPDSATWNNYGARLDVRVVGINYNNENCGSYSPTSGPYFSAVDGFSVRSSSNPSLASHSIGPSSHPFQVKFTASTTADTDTGRYTVCIGYFSPDGYISHRGVGAIHINVERHPWIQIEGPDNITSSMTGDVHSNSAIDLSVPLNKFFFRDGTAGVVSAYGSGGNISFNSSQTVNTANANLTNKLWRIPSYSDQIKTEAFSNLEALAIASLPNPATGLPDGLPSQASINAHCSQGSKVYKRTPATGELVIDQSFNLTSQPCANTSLVYFIDGDLRVNANVIDGTTSTTITFIVKDDIIVSPSVTQMDGVYIFGGTFRDGSAYNTAAGTKDQPLTIHGSLIGLATQSPISTKGTFSQGTYSGLQRNLSFGASGNDNLPAERIVYQPKYLFLLRNLLGASSFTWNE